MREALLIFRKDLHHLWPRIIPLLTVTTLWGWMECELFVANPVMPLLGIVWLLSTAFLAASVMQQEALPGNQQYWLTRPYHWGHLFLAKSLFLGVFAWLPVLAISAVSLSTNGVSPWRHVPLLLAATLASVGTVCSFMAALASVTENMAQFLWGFLPSIAAAILGYVVTSGNEDIGDWGNLEWIHASACAGVLLTASGTVLFLQYSFRKTAVSRLVLGAAVLTAATGPYLGPWHGAWAMESKLSKRQLDASAAQLAFDPSGRTPPGFADATYTPRTGQAGINLPVVMTAIPAGTEIVCERIAARIEAPDGRSWASTWTRTGGLYRTTPLEDHYLIPGDGSYWEYLNVDSAFYQAVKDAPVHVHTTVSLTLLGERKTGPLATRRRDEYASRDGLCRAVQGPFGKLVVSCAWLGYEPARSYITAVSIRNGQTYASLVSALSNDLFPIGDSVWFRGVAYFSAPTATREMDLETWEAVARFDRDLDLPQIRLADYAVRRITDMP